MVAFCYVEPRFSLFKILFVWILWPCVGVCVGVCGGLGKKAPFYEHLNVFKFAACFECVLGASHRHNGRGTDKWQMHFIHCIFYSTKFCSKAEVKCNESALNGCIKLGKYFVMYTHTHTPTVIYRVHMKLGFYHFGILLK